MLAGWQIGFTRFQESNTHRIRILFNRLVVPWVVRRENDGTTNVKERRKWWENWNFLGHRPTWRENENLCVSCERSAQFWIFQVAQRKLFSQIETGKINSLLFVLQKIYDQNSLLGQMWVGGNDRLIRRWSRLSARWSAKSQNSLCAIRPSQELIESINKNIYHVLKVPFMLQFSFRTAILDKI